MAGNEASPGKHFQKTADRKSVLTRDHNVYRANTSTGYKDGSWQAHHILCEHAVGGREFKSADKEFAEECLWVTEWKLNDSDNMVGMPIRSDFREKDGKMGMNICSHANDHNTKDGYTDECKDHLQTEIWDKIKKSGQNHTTEAKSIQGNLNTATSYFRGQLTARALREGGTLLMWTKRHDPAQKTKWYVPFSMAKDSAVVPRLPGAKSNLADKMVGLFQRIA